MYISPWMRLRPLSELSLGAGGGGIRLDLLALLLQLRRHEGGVDPLAPQQHIVCALLHHLVRVRVRVRVP